MTFLAWALCVYGVTLIVTRGSISLPLHSLAHRLCRPRMTKAEWELGAWEQMPHHWLCRFLECPMCVGFWSAAVVSLLGLSLVASSASAHSRWLLAFADGCAGAAWCWTWHHVLGKLGAD